jgi:formate hydrogenlyase subunit 6/NADH:ubiquinone oxidoreductase subunit I
VEAEGPCIEKTVLASCSMPVADGLMVETASERIRKLRQDVMGLMLSGTEITRRLKTIASRSGIPKKRSPRGKKDPCILCGLCVHACAEVIRARALAFDAAASDRHRVAERIVFDAQRCIGCGTCAALCPVDAIRMRDRGRQRDIILYGKRVSRFTLRTCAHCGKPYTTEEHLNFVASRIEGDAAGIVGDACPECARSRFSVALTGVFPPG